MCVCVIGTTYAHTGMPTRNMYRDTRQHGPYRDSPPMTHKPLVSPPPLYFPCQLPFFALTFYAPTLVLPQKPISDPELGGDMPPGGYGSQTIHVISG